MNIQANSINSACISVDFLVILDLDDRYLEARAIGIGTHGLVVATSEPLMPKARIKVNLMMDFASDYEYYGQVVRVAEDVTVPAFDDCRFLLSISLRVNPGHELIQSIKPQPLASHYRKAA